MQRMSASSFKLERDKSMDSKQSNLQVYVCWLFKKRFFVNFWLLIFSVKSFYSNT
jgi:hypothetical protein